MLIDSHCHLDAGEFDADRSEVMAAARAAGVHRLVVPGVSIPTFDRVRDCCRTYPGCVAAYGIHPLYVDQAPEGALSILEQWLVREGPVAVGEIGLDHFLPAADRERQAWFFQEQLKLARKHDLPVLLHVRRAVDPVLKYLRRIPVRGGIAHAFNGSRQQADAFIGLGFALGFGGALTFGGSTRIRQLAATLPLDAIVLETDAPDIPPAWLSRGRNTPAELLPIATILAELRGVPLAAVAAQTSATVARVLGLRC